MTTLAGFLSRFSSVAVFGKGSTFNPEHECLQDPDCAIVAINEVANLLPRCDVVAVGRAEYWQRMEAGHVGRWIISPRFPLISGEAQDILEARDLPQLKNRHRIFLHPYILEEQNSALGAVRVILEQMPGLRQMKLVGIGGSMSCSRHFPGSQRRGRDYILRVRNGCKELCERHGVRVEFV